MNFLVIGHTVVDKVVDKEHHTSKPGGIFYSVVSLLSQVEPDDRIFLCTNMDSQNARIFTDVYDRVYKKFVQRVNSIPRVELVIKESGEREETYSEIADNLILPETNLKRYDGILINMITGYDLSLSQLGTLRKNYNGLIYFDVHTLSRGIDKEFRRYFKRIKHFKKWAKYIDILQANESEMKTLSGKNEEYEIIKELISYGIKQIVITRAHKGASVFFKFGDSVNSVHGKAIQSKTFNKVGCGDVFGAVYFYNYIKNKNILWALEQANLYAGVAATYSEVKDFVNLKRDVHERIS